MDINDIKHLAVERIYLVPDASEGQLGYAWCDDPAPGLDMDPSEAVEYVRKDVHDAIIKRQASSARMGMDAAKQHGSHMEAEAKRLYAECSPQALESEREANAQLTERIAELEAQVEQHKAAEEMQINLRQKLDEELDRHKRMFAATCETLGEIQKALGNEVVGIEPQLVKELIEERDALAVHVERLQEALRGSLLLVENDLVPALEGSGEMDEDIQEWKSAMSESPITSLARRDALNKAEVVDQWADCLESIIRHVEAEHAKNANYPAIGAEGMGEFAADMRDDAEKLRQQAEK